MNAIVKMLTGLLFNVVMGVVLAAVVGVQPVRVSIKRSGQER